MEDSFLYHSKFSQFFYQYLHSKERECYLDIVKLFRSLFQRIGDFDHIKKINAAITVIANESLFDKIKQDSLDKLEDDDISYVEMSAHVVTVNLNQYGLLNDILNRILRSVFFPLFKESVYYEQMVGEIKNSNVICLSSIISISEVNKNRIGYFRTFIQRNQPPDKERLDFLEELICSYKPEVHKLSKSLSNTTWSEDIPGSVQDSLSKEVDVKKQTPKTKKLSTRKMFEAIQALYIIAVGILDQFVFYEGANVEYLDEGIRSYLLATISRVSEQLKTVQPKQSFYTSTKLRKKQKSTLMSAFYELEKLFLLPESTLFEWVSKQAFPAFESSTSFVKLILDENEEIQVLKGFPFDAVTLELRKRPRNKNNLKMLQEFDEHGYPLIVSSETLYFNGDENEVQQESAKIGELSRSSCGVSFRSSTSLEQKLSLTPLTSTLFPEGLRIYLLNDNSDIESDLDATQFSLLSETKEQEKSISYLIHTPDYTELVDLEETVKQTIAEFTFKNVEFQEPDMASKKLFHLGSDVFIELNENYNSRTFQCKEFLQQEDVIKYTVSLRKTKAFGFGIKFCLDSANTNFMVVTGFNVDRDNQAFNHTLLSPKLREVQINDILVGINGLYQMTEEADKSSISGIDFQQIVSLVARYEVDDVVEFSFMRGWEKFYKECHKCNQLMCRKVCLAYPILRGSICRVNHDIATAVETILESFFFSLNSSGLMQIIETLLIQRNIIFLSHSTDVLSSVFYFFEMILKSFDLRECYGSFSSVLPVFSLTSIIDKLKTKRYEGSTKSSTDSVACGICTRDFCLGSEANASDHIKEFIYELEHSFGIPLDNLKNEDSVLEETLLVDCDNGKLLASNFVAQYFVENFSPLSSCFSPIVPSSKKNKALSEITSLRKEYIQGNCDILSFVEGMQEVIDRFLKGTCLRNFAQFWFQNREGNFILYKEQFLKLVHGGSSPKSCGAFCNSFFSSELFPKYLASLKP